MFLKRKTKDHVGIYLSGRYCTMLPRTDSESIYEVPDADGKVVVELGFYEAVRPDQVAEFFRLGVDPHTGAWAWQRQST